MLQSSLETPNMCPSLSCFEYLSCMDLVAPKQFLTGDRIQIVIHRDLGHYECQMIQNASHPALEDAAADLLGSGFDLCPSSYSGVMKPFESIQSIFIIFRSEEACHCYEWGRR
eukprot:gnl/MRDRNA2_/MRDRNA2_224234_c0_seq1.p1 gnl/MRDRNA2_/MRDRNA2_224234_c0~~gnl/MRDRNA2_/MRDRNA2_224234_c0_seq1.p1  ORF type:complete len:113 (+),score=14.20 gnl/MRDRNA2_/MRDRNA2_224234_c0_seq1:96-434(+)